MLSAPEAPDQRLASAGAVITATYPYDRRKVHTIKKTVHECPIFGGDFSPDGEFPIHMTANRRQAKTPRDHAMPFSLLLIMRRPAAAASSGPPGARPVSRPPRPPCPAEPRTPALSAAPSPSAAQAGPARSGQASPARPRIVESWPHRRRKLSTITGFRPICDDSRWRVSAGWSVCRGIPRSTLHDAETLHASRAAAGNPPRSRDPAPRPADPNQDQLKLNGPARS